MILYDKKMYDDNGYSILQIQDNIIEVGNNIFNNDDWINYDNNLFKFTVIIDKFKINTKILEYLENCGSIINIQEDCITRPFISRIIKSKIDVSTIVSVNLFKFIDIARKEISNDSLDNEVYEFIDTICNSVNDSNRFLYKAIFLRNTIYQLAKNSKDFNIEYENIVRYKVVVTSMLLDENDFMEDINGIKYPMLYSNGISSGTVSIETISPIFNMIFKLSILPRDLFTTINTLISTGMNIVHVVNNKSTVDIYIANTLDIYLRLIDMKKLYKSNRLISSMIRQLEDIFISYNINYKVRY